MILQGEVAVDMLRHLMTPMPDMRDAQGRRTAIAVYHDGKRYGGFISMEHVQACINAQGWKEEDVTIKILTLDEQGKVIGEDN